MDRRPILLLVLCATAALVTAGCLGMGGDEPAPDDPAPHGGDDGGSGDGGEGGDTGPTYGFYNGSADPIEDAPGASPYENETNGYRLLIPDGWSQLGTAPLWYVGPDPGIDEPRRNLNVVVQPAEGLDQDEYVERGVERVERLMDAENVTLEAAVLGGDEATRLSFDGQFRGMDLTWIQLTAVHGGNAYSVTYTFPEGEDPGHEKELEAALAGFAFLDGGATGGGSAGNPTAGV